VGVGEQHLGGGHVGHLRHPVVPERAGQHLAVDEHHLLVQRAADALRDAALDLALDQRRVDRAPDVVGGDVVDHPDLAGAPVDLDLGAARKIVEVNCLAALAWVQAAHRAWMGEHGGAIVNVASVAGLRSTGVIAAYGASKAALIRLTEELAWQLGPKIRVNAVAPGVVKTKFADALYSADEERAASVYPMKRLGSPEDVARLIGFLASDEAAWITGETVRVDGGLLATGGI